MAIPDWILVNPASGQGNVNAKVTASENNTDSVRAGEITVKTSGKGGISKTAVLTVIQQTTAASSINLDPLMLSFDKIEDTKEIQIVHSGNFNGVAVNFLSPSASHFVSKCELVLKRSYPGDNGSIVFENKVLKTFDLSASVAEGYSLKESDYLGSLFLRITVGTNFTNKNRRDILSIKDFGFNGNFSAKPTNFVIAQSSRLPSP